MTNSYEDKFSLVEGQVTFQYPRTLSEESFQDLCAWLEVLKRKMGRSVVTPLEEIVTPLDIPAQIR